MDWVYEDVLKRLKEQGVSTEGKGVLIQRYGASLNGERISGLTISEDGRWVCVPVYDDEGSNLTGRYEYKPQCYEILDKFQCYTGEGLIVLTDVFLLNNI